MYDSMITVNDRTEETESADNSKQFYKRKTPFTLWLRKSFSEVAYTSHLL